MGIVAIPGRNIHPKFQAVPMACIRYLSYHIAFALFPGAVADVVVSGFGGPQAEAIVVLASKDSGLHAARL